MSKVSKQQAEKEINEWFDFARVRASVRKAKSHSFEILVESVMDGSIVINPDKTITLILIDPLEGTKEVVFTPRYKVEDLFSIAKTVEVPDGGVLSVLAAMSKKPTGVFLKFSNVDYSIASAIAVFF